MQAHDFPLPGAAPQPSPKSYGTAVALSAVFGFAGVQHFYLGRVALGLLDLGMSFGWFVAFLIGQPVLGAVLLIADLGHAFVVTIQLLTGNFADGEGRTVCYPGQQLPDPFANQHMRSTST